MVVVMVAEAVVGVVVVAVVVSMEVD